VTGHDDLVGSAMESIILLLPPLGMLMLLVPLSGRGRNEK
jgi:hypothetical protein